MAEVVARSTEPTLAAIKLAWWRERLEELDRGKVPAEPRLQAAFHNLLPKGIRGADLAELETGWAGLLRPDVDMKESIAAEMLGHRNSTLPTFAIAFDF